MSIAAATRMGAVHLTVGDLDRSLRFYSDVFGLEAEGHGGEARLRDLLVLHEEPGAEPAPGHTGLFHFALLVPERADLAAWLRHAAELRAPITGASDHFVSEAIYLRDPDGHGIEIYRDLPRSGWDWQGGTVRMGTVPLDVKGLLEEPGDAFEAVPAGTTMGHVHLHVRDVPEAERFYVGKVGFDKTVGLGSEATFLSAGGYHHHLGANVWAGRGAPPPPPGSAALRHFTIVVPDEAERDRITGELGEPEESDVGQLFRDPSQNAFQVLMPRGRGWATPASTPPP